MGRNKSKVLPDYVEKYLKTAPNEGAEFVIRARERSNGRYSIFLDHYLGKVNGKVTHESISFNDKKRGKNECYLVPELTKEDKKHNKEVWSQALAFQMTYNNASREERLGLKKSKSQIDFLYFLEHEPDLMRNGKTANHYLSLIKHLKTFTDGRIIRFEEIDKNFVLDFLDYLRNSAERLLWRLKDSNKIGLKLKPKSQYNIQTALRHALVVAYQKEYVRENPFDRIDRKDLIKADEAEVCYLTVEEVQKLIDTPMRYKKHEILKKMFLFCCLSGLRFSDANSMKWGDIHEVNGGFLLTKRIKKTDKLEYFPLSSSAVAFLPERKKDDDIIFPCFASSTFRGEILQRWADAAGIKKKVRFHVSRHTAATLNLSLGVDIYTVSKLLGHASVKTTQIYADVLAESKRRAVDLQDGIFNLKK